MITRIGIRCLFVYVSKDLQVDQGSKLHSSLRRFEELLWVFGLNKIAAPLQEILRGGAALRKTRLIRDFYSQILPADSLVFDIGANIGDLTRVFAALGARVVAVEPNSDCVRHIELTTERDRVETLQAAAGGKNGLGVLGISDRKDKMSSLSREWRDAMEKANSDYAGMWKREAMVPVITLDSLIERYGMPQYIKIDVEGFEEQVLRGLSSPPQLLSFEFNRAFFDALPHILKMKIFENAEFNFTLVDPCKFALGEWTDSEHLLQALTSPSCGAGVGDVFARCGKR